MMQGIEAADSVFELASVLVAKAGWEFRRAAYLCRDTRPGISTDQAVKVAFQISAKFAGDLARCSCSCFSLVPGEDPIWTETLPIPLRNDIYDPVALFCFLKQAHWVKGPTSIKRYT